MTAAGGALFGQALRYAATGVVNTAAGYAVIVALHQVFGFGIVAANAAGYAVGLVISFALNRSWTFAHRGAVLPAVAGFLGVVGAAFALNLGVVLGLAEVGLPYLAAQAAGTLVYSLIVFFGFRHVVFAADR